MTWRCIKQILSADEQFKLEFQADNQSGLYRWQHFAWWHPCDMDEGAIEEGFWMAQDTSGLFGQLHDCEAEARSMFYWLKETHEIFKKK